MIRRATYHWRAALRVACSVNRVLRFASAHTSFFPSWLKHPCLHYYNQLTFSCSTSALDSRRHCALLALYTVISKSPFLGVCSEPCTRGGRSIHSMGLSQLARQLIEWVGPAYVLGKKPSEWDRGPFARQKSSMFTPASQIILVTLRNFQITPVFHYPTHATKDENC